MEYSVVDIISFRRENRGAVTTIDKRSTPARVIGLEDSSDIWCIREGVPALVERNKCMPASAAQ
eukprot:10982733-Karenia_brevis.AAC.1